MPITIRPIQSTRIVVTGSLIKKYDQACPRGSCRTDLPADIKRYIAANPKAVKQSSTAHYDETILARLRASADTAQDGNSDAGDDAATEVTEQ